MRVGIVQGPTRIVQVSGEIDYSNVKEFNAALQDAIRDFPQGFIIDLSDVTYLDSAGIQAIFFAYQQVHKVDGKLALVTQNPTVKELLEIVHIDRLPGILMCDDVPDAEEAFAAQ